MRNILLIHHGRGLGGGLIALLGLIDKLKTNYQIRVFCIFDGIAAESLRNAGVSVVVPKSSFYRKCYEIFIYSTAEYFNIIESIKKVSSLFWYVLNKYYYAQKELKKILLENEIVYLNSAFVTDWARPAKRLGKKVIIHVREPLSKGILGFGRRIIKDAIEKDCDHIIAISRDNAKRIGIPKKTTIIYDPVVTKDRDSQNLIQTNDSLKYFVYVGGMIRIKGIEQMVQSLKDLNDNVRLFFLGPKIYINTHGIKRKLRQLLDPYFWKYKCLESELARSPKIIYVGETKDVFSYYKKSIALISPFSKPHASLPILEAFSLGLPVIVSNIEGMDELVDGKNGYFFENNNAKSLAKTINAIATVSEVNYKLMKEASIKKYREIQNDIVKISDIVEAL
jgi:glycosyltransferase involved in cell wall biosynthesis